MPHGETPVHDRQVIRVLHFTDGEVLGGAEQILFHILTGLDRQRWQPMLFHHGEPGLTPLLEKVQSLGIAQRAVPRMQTVKDIRQLPRLVRALREESPAIFHAHLTWPLSCKYGLIAAILARIPVIVATVHVYVEPPRRWWVHAQLRIIAAAMARFLPVSHGVARRLCQSLGIPPSKTQVIHNGIYLAPFKRSADPNLRAALSGGSERPIVLVIARLEEQKGHRYLVTAASQVPDVVFVFAGAGTERARLEVQANDLKIGDRVKFLGHRDDIPDLLAVCDILVLPSLFEGLPVSILEAMAACKPVIATAIDGNDEVITDGENGLLVPAADPRALAGAIRLLLADRALAQRLATAGQMLSEQHFSAEKMVRNVTRVYDELIG